MGHVRIYTISDALARFHRLNGRQVIHPMGWDAFGLPAENAAVQHGVAAEDWTQSNIRYMKQQFVKLGMSFDWQRELATCSPEYYKWTQLIFLQLFQRGLAYRQEAFVNWDPVDGTVLAEEQVDANGCSWRSGAKVERRLLKQWFVRTTRFAEALSAGLDELSLADWGDIIKLQRHWIGACDGFHFDLPLAGASDRTLGVWTPTPESLNTARFVVLKPGHVLDADQWIDSSSPEGLTRLSLEVVNPISGRRLPVVVSDLIDFADGCDVRLVDPLVDEDAAPLAQKLTAALADDGANTASSAEEICERALSENWGGHRTSSKLRDWLISRQRHWGTPIPIIHCPDCGTVPVPVDQLPVTLPSGTASLANNADFVNVACPQCGAAAKRETDTMDTFVDSTWYFLRYLDPTNSERPFDLERARSATPVDIYIGGKEHAVLHLYYARFMSHFLHSLGWLPQREPFRRLLVQGMVMGRSYRVKATGQYLRPDQVDLTGPKPLEAGTGRALTVAWEKMSKSKFNGVEPETVWAEHGVDTTRLLILADVSPRSSRNWSKDTYPGILNWQERMWSLLRDLLARKSGSTATRPLTDAEAAQCETRLRDARNFYVKGVTFNIHTTQLISVAISKMQGLTTTLRKVPPKHLQLIDSFEYERAMASLIVMLSPLAPHFASELWSVFVDNARRLSTDVQWDKPLLEQRWPEIDRDYQLDLICKVNGQDCCVIKLPMTEFTPELLDQQRALQLFRQNESFLKYHSTRKVVRTEFDLCPGIQAMITLITEQKPKKKALSS